MDRLIQDIRGALRFVLRHPWFTGVAVVTLGIGIGANTAIFSGMHAVVLRPLPFPEPDRLLLIQQQSRARGLAFQFSYLDYEDLRESTRSFTELAAVANTLSVVLWEEMTRQASVAIGETEEGRRLAARAAADRVVDELGVVGGISVQLRSWDLLWFGLAVATAYGMMNRPKEDEESGEAAAVEA